jgi:hypothetical protein
MISFFGAEFTQVYANMYGSRVQPAENAVPLTREARARQGIPQREDLEEARRSGKSAEEAGMVPLTGKSAEEDQRELSLETARMRQGAWEEAPSTAVRPLPRRDIDLPKERSLKAFSALSMLIAGVTGGFVMGRIGKRKNK